MGTSRADTFSGLQLLVQKHEVSIVPFYGCQQLSNAIQRGDDCI